VLNSPLRYRDPTGHVFIEGTGGGNSTVIRAMAPCVVCQPTPTPYPTSTPLIGPTATPAGPSWNTTSSYPGPQIGAWIQGDVNLGVGEPYATGEFTSGMHRFFSLGRIRPVRGGPGPIVGGPKGPGGFGISGMGFYYSQVDVSVQLYGNGSYVQVTHHYIAGTDTMAVSVKVETGLGNMTDPYPAGTMPAFSSQRVNVPFTGIWIPVSEGTPNSLTVNLVTTTTDPQAIVGLPGLGAPYAGYEVPINLLACYPGP